MTARVIQGFFPGGMHRLGVSGALQPMASPGGSPAPRPAPGRPPLVHSSGGRATGAIQRFGGDGSFAIDPAQVGLVRNGGKPLPQALLAKMEAAFGADFSGVRVHVGPQASRIGALAFTTGSDLYFAPGQYQPDSIKGQQLIGHELAHVIQQRQGRVRAPGNGVAVVHNRALEAEADQLGTKAAAYRDPINSGTFGGSSRDHIGSRRATGIPTLNDLDCNSCQCAQVTNTVANALQTSGMPYSRWQNLRNLKVTRQDSRGVMKRHKISTEQILSYGRTRKRPNRLGQGLCAGYPNHVFATAFAIYTVGRQFVGGHTDVCFDRQQHAAVNEIANFNMTGSRALDAIFANATRGLPGTPVGYTWHHKHDFVAVGAAGGRCTMQLVISDCHNNIFHHGAVAQWNALYPANLYA